CAFDRTLIDIVQLPPAAAIVPLASVRVVDPAVLPVTVPPQVFVNAGVEATWSPAGKVSVKPSPVTPPEVALLVMVMVIVPTPVPTLALKLLAADGVLLTVIEALVAAVLLPALDV